jgi:hypothetical protein
MGGERHLYYCVERRDAMIVVEISEECSKNHEPESQESSRLQDGPADRIEEADP